MSPLSSRADIGTVGGDGRSGMVDVDLDDGGRSGRP